MNLLLTNAMEDSQRIHDYLDGLLSGEALERFEQQLKEDSLLAQKVEEIRTFEQQIPQAFAFQQEKESLKQLFESITPEEFSPSSQAKKPWYTQPRYIVAASLFLAIVIVFIWRFTGTTEPLNPVAYAQSDRIPAFVDPSMGLSIEAPDSFELGVQAYLNEDYDNARQVFQTVPSSDSTYHQAQLLIGISHLVEDNPEQALPYLETAHITQPNQDTQEKRLYLALTYLALNRNPEAQSLLNQIVADNSIHHILAQEILKKIE